MRRSNAQSEDSHRLVKAVLGIMTLVCISTGLIVYLFAQQLGFDEDTAQIVAIAFLAAGVGDYIVLKLWDRIVAKR